MYSCILSNDFPCILLLIYLYRMEDQRTESLEVTNYVMQDMTGDIKPKIPSTNFIDQAKVRKSRDESCDQDIIVTVIDANHSSCNHHNNRTSDCNSVLTEGAKEPFKLNGKSHGSKCRKKKMLAVETKNICFKYRSSPSLILSDVSMQIPEGTMYVLHALLVLQIAFCPFFLRVVCLLHFLTR